MLVSLLQGMMDGWPGGHPSSRPIEGGKEGPPDRPGRPAAGPLSDAPRPERPSVLPESMGSSFSWNYAGTTLKEGPYGPDALLLNYFPTESNSATLSAHNGLAGPRSRIPNGRYGRWQSGGHMPPSSA